MKASQRGDLNAGERAISATPVKEEDFALAALGNWAGYVQKSSGSTDLDHSRTANKVDHGHRRDGGRLVGHAGL